MGGFCLVAHTSSVGRVRCDRSVTSSSSRPPLGHRCGERGTRRASGLLGGGLDLGLSSYVDVDMDADVDASTRKG